MAPCRSDGTGQAHMCTFVLAQTRGSTQTEAGAWKSMPSYRIAMKVHGRHMNRCAQHVTGLVTSRCANRSLHNHMMVLGYERHKCVHAAMRQ